MEWYEDTFQNLWAAGNASLEANLSHWMPILKREISNQWSQLPLNGSRKEEQIKLKVSTMKK